MNIRIYIANRRERGNCTRTIAAFTFEECNCIVYVDRTLYFYQFQINVSDCAFAVSLCASVYAETVSPPIVFDEQRRAK